MKVVMLESAPGGAFVISILRRSLTCFAPSVIVEL